MPVWVSRVLGLAAGVATLTPDEAGLVAERMQGVRGGGPVAVPVGLLSARVSRSEFVWAIDSSGYGTDVEDQVVEYWFFPASLPSQTYRSAGPVGVDVRLVDDSQLSRAGHVAAGLPWSEGATVLGVRFEAVRDSASGREAGTMFLDGQWRDVAGAAAWVRLNGKVDESGRLLPVVFVVGEPDAGDERRKLVGASPSALEFGGGVARDLGARLAWHALFGPAHVIGPDGVARAADGRLGVAVRDELGIGLRPAAGAVDSRGDGAGVGSVGASSLAGVSGEVARPSGSAGAPAARIGDPSRYEAGAGSVGRVGALVGRVPAEALVRGARVRVGADGLVNGWGGLRVGAGEEGRSVGVWVSGDRRVFLFDVESGAVLAEGPGNASWPDGAEVVGSVWVQYDGGEWVQGRFTRGLLGAVRFIQTLPGGTERSFRSTSPNVWHQVLVGGADDTRPSGSRGSGDPGGSLPADVSESGARSGAGPAGPSSLSSPGQRRFLDPAGLQAVDLPAGAVGVYEVLRRSVPRRWLMSRLRDDGLPANPTDDQVLAAMYRRVAAHVWEEFDRYWVVIAGEAGGRRAEEVCEQMRAELAARGYSSVASDMLPAFVAGTFGAVGRVVTGSGRVWEIGDAAGPVVTLVHAPAGVTGAAGAFPDRYLLGAPARPAPRVAVGAGVRPAFGFADRVLRRAPGVDAGEVWRLWRKLLVGGAAEVADFEGLADIQVPAGGIGAGSAYSGDRAQAGIKAQRQTAAAGGGSDSCQRHR